LETVKVTEYYMRIKSIIEDKYMAIETKQIRVGNILEEVYQAGKYNKFKDIGYIDVDEFYPEDKKGEPDGR